MVECLLVGWEEIHEMLKDQKGDPVISLRTLQQGYGPDMKRLGIVLELNLGRSKKPSICAWPSKVQLYFQIRQQNKWAEKYEKEVMNALDL